MRLQDDREYYFGNDYLVKNQPKQYTSNFIETSKYNIITFLPVSLMLQFRQYANIYFLITAILQCFPIISTLNPLSAIAPLVFVIALSMIREAMEDISRHQSDQELNSSPCRILVNGKFVLSQWMDVKIGDIMLIEDQDMISADTIVIYSSLDTGMCFIQTSSLDGEKNLKPKSSLVQIQNIIHEAVQKWQKDRDQDPQSDIDFESFVFQPKDIWGKITCSPPNPMFHSFQGCMFLRDDEEGNSKKLVVNHKNLLLRGSRLKNVQFVIGVVTYTGKDTQVMRNSDPPQPKSTNIEKKTNVFILAILIIQLACCSTTAFLNIENCDKPTNLYEDIYKKTGCSQQFFVAFAAYFLLLNTMIPISLIVSLEFIKVGQAYFMEQDQDLYSAENGKHLKVFTCQLNQELGQIQHIFTDKTGTLTCNQMEFQMVVCGAKTYGDLNLKQVDLTQVSLDNDSSATAKQTERQQEQKEQQNVIGWRQTEMRATRIESQSSVPHIQENETNQNNNEPQKDEPVHNPNAGRKRAPSFVDQKGGIQFCFMDKNLLKLLDQPNDQSNVRLDFQMYAGSIKESEEGSEPIHIYQTQRDLVCENLMILSCCHQCVIQQQKGTGQTIYQGPSPDQIALVDAARHIGFQYLGARLSNIKLSILGREQELEMLNMFEFDSDRKRMSVIVRHRGQVKMYVKGADSIIISRLKKDTQPYLSKIQTQLEFFSQKGLRTLCLAVRYLTNQEYEEFRIRVAACTDHPNREQMVAQLAGELEENLYLIGATAVEDRLQDLVPQTLRDFLQANINVWMLTGDKMETAENIGRSCNLLTQNMTILYIKSTDNDLENRLQELEYEAKISISDGGIGLLVEGEALARILSEEGRTLAFLRIIFRCQSVICCRVTPKQKADVVRLVKTRLNKITLSVGDGANDVNMIQQAHIGVGIYGNQGMRAVQASNYAIGQFKCLWQLVLYHGRLNYIRISECILYFFYKNMIFTLPQLYFAFFCLYSAQSIFDDWYITLFNCVFTFWPVVIRAVFEEDVYYRKQTDSSGKEIEYKKKIKDFSEREKNFLREYYPRLYYIGQKNHIFQKSRFFKWIFLGFFQGGVCFFIHMQTLAGDISLDSEGFIADIWIFSISLFTSIIILVNLKLALNTQFWTVLTWAGFLLTSIGAYFTWLWISDNIRGVVVYKTAVVLFESPLFYFCVIVSILSMFALDLMLFSFKISKDNLLNYYKRIVRTQEEGDQDKLQYLDTKLKKKLFENRKTEIQLEKRLNASPGSLSSPRKQGSKDDESQGNNSFSSNSFAPDSFVERKQDLNADLMSSQFSTNPN